MPRTDGGRPGRSRRGSGSDRRHALLRRRVTLGALGLGVAVGAVLLAVSPSLGAAIFVPFMVLFAVDLGLLVAHAQRRAERMMSLAFRSERKGRAHPAPHHRLGG